MRLTVDETETNTGINRKTLYSAIKAGRLRHQKVILLSPEDVAAAFPRQGFCLNGQFIRLGSAEFQAVERCLGKPVDGAEHSKSSQHCA